MRRFVTASGVPLAALSERAVPRYLLRSDPRPSPHGPSKGLAHIAQWAIWAYFSGAMPRRLTSTRKTRSSTLTPAQYDRRLDSLQRFIEKGRRRADEARGRELVRTLLPPMGWLARSS